MTIYKNQSPWGSPPGSGGGSGNGGGFRRGPTPPNLDEAIKKLQDTINRFTGSGKGGSKPIIFGLIILISISNFKLTLNNEFTNKGVYINKNSKMDT